MNIVKKFNIIVISYLLVVSFIGLVTLSSNQAKAQSDYSLYDAAITYSYITVTIQGEYDGDSIFVNLATGDGFFFGRCIEMTATSQVSSTLQITVNLGRQLICRESDIQNMVVTKEYIFTLSSYGTETFTVYAMCMNMYEDAPVAGIYYDLGPVVSGDAYTVVRQILDSDYQDAAGQCSLWAITDNADADYLRDYGATNDDINNAQGILHNAGVSYNLEKGSGEFPLTWIIIILIIIIVVVILVIVIFKMSKRKKKVVPAKPSSPVQSVAPVQPASKVQTTPKFCTNCGAPITTGVKFCTECGHPVL